MSHLRMCLPAFEGHQFPQYVYIMNCKIFFWNCGGAVSEEFLDCLLDFLKEYKPGVLILVETKTS